ncbi:MAG: hypothetical protein NTW19_23465 [Planctomycetota bacterium]|nr:hypothetical protein [Planctomycetota bacterium]
MAPSARRWLKALVVVLVLVLAVVVGVWFYLDTIARIGVEKAATSALGVSTTLDSMSLRLVRGECALKGLKVSNPSGFDSTHFMTLKSGDIAVAPASLLEPKVVIPEVKLSGIDVNMELKNGKANYQVILDSVKQTQGQGTSGGSGGSGKKFVIKKLVIEDVTVHAALVPVGGDLTRAKIVLDRIELTNIGEGSANGVELAQVASEVTRAILQAVSAKAGGILPPEMLQGLGNGLAGVTKLGQQTTQAVAGTVKEVGKAVTEIGKGVGEVGKGIGGIFGGKDKEKAKTEEK